jgi:hypothetical protein
MVAFTSLFLLALLATIVRADVTPRVTITRSPTSLSFSTRLKLANGQRIADIERARTHAAGERATHGQDNSVPINVPAENAIVSTHARSGIW